MTPTPSLEEFLRTARDEFNFLVSERGFSEQLDTREYANPFAVYYSDGKTAVRVEGVQWGFSIQVMLIDLSGSSEVSQIPLWVIVQLRSEAERSTAVGQLAQLVRDSNLIRDYADDILRGDFSVFPSAQSLMMELHEEAQKPKIRVLP